MYRNGSEYDAMAKLVIDIYIDYRIVSFPVMVKDVCKKLGVALIPYREYPSSERDVLKRRSKSGFYVPPTANSPPMIFFNDCIAEVGSVGNLRRNIFHEVKHYVSGDLVELPEDDDLADYFGKYFLAPIPYLITKKIYNPNQIISDFGVDADMAWYIAKNLRNRRAKYGEKIFDYEEPLIEHLLGKQL